MRITIGELLDIILEARYKATAPKRFGVASIEVDADSTMDAAQRATDKWYQDQGVRGIDPFSVDLEPAPLQPDKSKSRWGTGMDAELDDIVQRTINGEEMWGAANDFAYRALYDKAYQIAGDDDELADDLFRGEKPNPYIEELDKHLKYLEDEIKCMYPQPTPDCDEDRLRRLAEKIKSLL